MAGVGCTVRGIGPPVVLLTETSLEVVRAAGKDAWLFVAIGLLGGSGTAEDIAAECGVPLAQVAGGLQRLLDTNVISHDEDAFRWPEQGDGAVPRRRRKPPAYQMSDGEKTFIADALAAAYAYPELASLQKGPKFRLAVTRIAKRLFQDGDDLTTWLGLWREMLADPRWRSQAAGQPSKLYAFRATKPVTTKNQDAAAVSAGGRRAWKGWG